MRWSERFQAKDMHIRERNKKVLGKSAIKKGAIFQEADPLRWTGVGVLLLVYDNNQNGANAGVL